MCLHYYKDKLIFPTAELTAYKKEVFMLVREFFVTYDDTIYGMYDTLQEAKSEADDVRQECPDFAYTLTETLRHESRTDGVFYGVIAHVVDGRNVLVKKMHTANLGGV